MATDTPIDRGLSLPISRRTLIGSAALAAAGIAIGAKPAEGHGTLVSYNNINGQSTYLFDRDTDVMGTSPHSFQYNSTFHSRLNAWATFYYQNTLYNWANPTIFAVSAVHRDTVIDGTNQLSWHASGRAIDLERIYVTDSNTGNRLYAANLRGYQLASLARTHREWQKYWGAVASLVYHFDYVLHYYYEGHQDHVHADNANSGSGNSTFSTSTVKIKFVQASLNSIWGENLTVDGSYGNLSKAAGKRAMTRLGYSGQIDTSLTNWQAYLRGTTQRGTGLSVG